MDVDNNNAQFSHFDTQRNRDKLNCSQSYLNKMILNSADYRLAPFSMVLQSYQNLYTQKAFGAISGNKIQTAECTNLSFLFRFFFARKIPCDNPAFWFLFPRFVKCKTHNVPISNFRRFPLLPWDGYFAIFERS